MKDWDGLCMMPGALEQENKITIEERNFLSSFFREHFSLLEFNWTKGLKEPRIRWLEKQIKTLKDD